MSTIVMWLILQVPLSLLVGHFIAVGMGTGGHNERTQHSAVLKGAGIEVSARC